ncbi:hypothetical protein NDA16_000918 [Ustilago loliicola]|nr:hypothetical protein NDA16_000918 [Ustilago loliicola]
MVISYLVRRDLHGQAIEVYEEMLDFGVEPEASLRNTMIRVNLAVGNVKDAEAHLEHMKQEQRQLGLDTLTTTVEGLCKLVSTGKVKDTDPMMAKLRTYASELRKAVEALPAGTRDSSSWRTLLRYEAIVLGPAHALETARQTSRSGVADFRTLNMLLRAHVEELKELQSSDEALELLDRVQSAIDPQRRIQPDDNCYNILMLGLLDNSGGESALLEEDVDLSPDDGTNGSTVRQPRSHPTPNQVREAQLFYDHIRSLGIPPTPLLRRP